VHTNYVIHDDFVPRAIVKGRRCLS